MAKSTTGDVEFVSTSRVVLYRCSASDLDVARAAWVSQSPDAHVKERDPGRVEGLIRFLWRNHHTSPFEHGQFTFVITTPLFMAREFMRHRTFSFNEISGRYVELPASFYVPPQGRPLVQTGRVGDYKFSSGDAAMCELTRDVIVAQSRSSYAAYEKLLAAGVAREVARSVLPLNLMTTFWASVNPRNLMHFLDLRTATDALYEIREVGDAMAEHLRERMPITHDAWRTSRDELS
ncbi:FAD-dependent thymidylate synthase [Barrientosiimonas humi]|uniref:FAD-dependent thymidylate synthase n=1 Tax=Barrientosiimonas humi TaxID=999931 RepID=UPI00370D67E4